MPRNGGPAVRLHGDAAFAAEELGNDQHHRRDQLADAERDHRERRAGLLGRDVAEQRREEHAGEAADQRHQAHRNRKRAIGDAEHGVHGHEGAEAGVDGVAEAQHAALAEQHVVRQAGDDADADLRQHRPLEVAAAARAARRAAPGRSRPTPASRPRPTGRATDAGERPSAGAASIQPSRVPSRPLGRKIRISTRNR